mgnify:CR=1 FL=1
MRTCPNCTKPIEDDAVKCPYCGKMTDYNENKKNIKFIARRCDDVVILRFLRR